MKDPFTGCPDAKLEPDYPENQSEINRFFYMSQAADEIIASLKEKDYDLYFHDEIVSFFANILWKLRQEREKMDGECY